MKETDRLREIFQSKFKDFEAPLPPDGWEKIEAELQSKQRVVVMRRRWYATAAAVAALLIGGLFFLQTPDNSPPNTSEFVQQQEQEQFSDTQNEAKPTPERTDVSPEQKLKTPKLFAKNKTKPTSQKSMSEKLLLAKAQTDAVRENEFPISEITVTKDQQNEEKNISDKKAKDETPKLTRQEAEERMREFSRAAESDNLFAQETGKTERPMMLALNAKGGLTPFQKTVNKPMSLRSASATKADNSDKNLLAGEKDLVLNSMAFANTRAANNVAEMEHAQPFSFGVTVSKSIIDKLSIETGLVYTYLFSRVINSSADYNTQETQHFHYVGVPLNVNYNIFSFGKLDVYTSLGGMIEKDIKGERKYEGQNFENEFKNSSELVNTVKIKQENPQLSVNAGIGVSYPIYKGLNLYGKVGGSYYFDAKNEHKTIYTDKQIVLDLNAGIRFEF